MYLTGAEELFPPIIEIQPQSATIDLYDSLNLTCIAAGYPQPNVTWYKDDSEIEDEGSSFLVIREVQLSDRGVYFCNASNILGSAMSSLAYINLNGM